MKPEQPMDADERAFWKKVGTKIVQARRDTRKVFYDGRRQSVTQSDLARELGVSRASIANIETGRQRVTLYTMKRIMMLLPSLRVRA